MKEFRCTFLIPLLGLILLPRRCASFFLPGAQRLQMTVLFSSTMEPSEASLFLTNLEQKAEAKLEEDQKRLDELNGILADVRAKLETAKRLAVEYDDNNYNNQNTFASSLVEAKEKLQKAALLAKEEEASLSVPNVSNSFAAAAAATPPKAHATPTPKSIVRRPATPVMPPKSGARASTTPKTIASGATTPKPMATTPAATSMTTKPPITAATTPKPMAVATSKPMAAGATIAPKARAKPAAAVQAQKPKALGDSGKKDVSGSMDSPKKKTISLSQDKQKKKQQPKPQPKSSPFSFFFPFLGEATTTTTPTITMWYQDEFGAIVGYVSNSTDFEDGTKILTTPVDSRLQAKPNSVVTTKRGSKYILGIPLSLSQVEEVKPKIFIMEPPQPTTPKATPPSSQKVSQVVPQYKTTKAATVPSQIISEPLPQYQTIKATPPSLLFDDPTMFFEAQDAAKDTPPVQKGSDLVQQYFAAVHQKDVKAEVKEEAKKNAQAFFKKAEAEAKRKADLETQKEEESQRRVAAAAEIIRLREESKAKRTPEDVARRIPEAGRYSIAAKRAKQNEAKRAAAVANQVKRIIEQEEARRRESDERRREVTEQILLLMEGRDDAAAALREETKLPEDVVPYKAQAKPKEDSSNSSTKKKTNSQRGSAMSLTRQARTGPPNQLIKKVEARPIKEGAKGFFFAQKKTGNPEAADGEDGISQQSSEETGRELPDTSDEKAEFRADRDGSLQLEELPKKKPSKDLTGAQRYIMAARRARLKKETETKQETKDFYFPDPRADNGTIK